MTTTQRYPVGTQYTDRHGRVCTVIDFLVTTNLEGLIVHTEYLCTHELMGQRIDSRENEVHIARGVAGDLAPKASRRGRVAA